MTHDPNQIPDPAQPIRRADMLIERSDDRHVRRDAARGGMASLIQQGISFALFLGSTAILARLLEVEDFGLFAFVTSITMVLAKFRDAGLRLANVQAKTLTNGQATTLLLINTGLGLLLGLITAGIGLGLSAVRDQPVLTPLFLIMGCSYLIGAIGVQSNGILHRRMQLTSLAAVEIAALVVSIGVGVTAALLGQGVFSLAWMHLAMNASKSAFSIVRAGWLPTAPASLRETAPLIRFGIALSIASAVNMTGANADRMFLGWKSELQNGLYSKAIGLAALPIERITPAFAQVAIPTLSRYADEPKAYRRTYHRLLSGLLLMTTPVTCGLFLEAHAIIRIVLGEKWLDAVPIFQLLCIGSLLLPLWNSTGWLFVSQGRGRAMIGWQMCDASAKITASAIAVQWGVKGLAIAFSLRYVFLIPVLFGLIGRRGAIQQGFLYGHLGTVALLSLPGLAAAEGVLLGLRTLEIEPIWGMGAAVYGVVFLATVGLVRTQREQALYFADIFTSKLRRGGTGG